MGVVGRSEGKLEEDGDSRTRAERQQRGQTLEQRKDVIRETVGKRKMIEKTSGEDIKKRRRWKIIPENRTAGRFRGGEEGNSSVLVPV